MLVGPVAEEWFDGSVRTGLLRGYIDGLTPRCRGTHAHLQLSSKVILPAAFATLAAGKVFRRSEWTSDHQQVKSPEVVGFQISLGARVGPSPAHGRQFSQSSGQGADRPSSSWKPVSMPSLSAMWMSRCSVFMGVPIRRWGAPAGPVRRVGRGWCRRGGACWFRTGNGVRRIAIPRVARAGSRRPAG